MLKKNKHFLAVFIKGKQALIIRFYAEGFGKRGGEL